MKVLYVEDNPANVFLVKRVARMGNHEIINYIDGNQALSKFEEISPDLVLMDIQLAGDKSGLDVVKELRSRGVKTPIIAVTAYAMVGDKERCIEAGCDDYLAKPLPIPRLVEMFKEYSEAASSKAPAVEAKPAPAAPEKTETPVAEIKSETEKSTTPVAEAKVEHEKSETPVAEVKSETEKSTTPVAEAKVEHEKSETPLAEVKSEPEASTSDGSEISVTDPDATVQLKTEPEAAAPETTITSESEASANTTEAPSSTSDETTKKDDTPTEPRKDDTSGQNELAKNATSADTDSNVAETLDSVTEVPTGE